MQEAAAVTNPVRALLVDDTEDLRELMRYALAREGIEVVGEAGDGASALEVAREAEPNLILLDLSMPVMDGLTALPFLRELAPEAKIVILSGYTPEQVPTTAAHRCADGYVQKGLPLRRLVQYIREVLAAPPGGPQAPALTLAS